MRLLPLVAATLLLGGCWVGERFYADSEARPAIPAGLYRSPTDDCENDLVRVTILPSGLTRFDGESDDWDIAGFAPLGSDGRRYVAWLLAENGETPNSEVAYALLERRGREYLIFAPACEHTQTLAQTYGAEIVPDRKMTMCRFRDRQSLEMALSRLEFSPVDAARLVPVS